MDFYNVNLAVQETNFQDTFHFSKKIFQQNECILFSNKLNFDFILIISMSAMLIYKNFSLVMTGLPDVCLATYSPPQLRCSYR